MFLVLAVVIVVIVGIVGVVIVVVGEVVGAVRVGGGGGGDGRGVGAVGFGLEPEKSTHHLAVVGVFQADYDRLGDSGVREETLFYF